MSEKNTGVPLFEGQRYIIKDWFLRKMDAKYSNGHRMRFTPTKSFRESQINRMTEKAIQVLLEYDSNGIVRHFNVWIPKACVEGGE